MLTQPQARIEEIKAIMILDNEWMASQADEAVKREQARKAKTPGR